MKAEQQHLYPKLTLSLKLTLIFCFNPYPITRTNHLCHTGRLTTLFFRQIFPISTGHVLQMQL
jgi:hypothetical protein